MRRATLASTPAIVSALSAPHEPNAAPGAVTGAVEPLVEASDDVFDTASRRELRAAGFEPSG